MENFNKQRHGCVTAWLILMIIANAFTAALNLLAGDYIANNYPGEISKPMMMLLGIVAIANVIFAILLLFWKKIGFWGFLTTSLGTFVINVSIGLGIMQSSLGLIGIAILYGVLQIKEDNHTAWENLE